MKITFKSEKQQNPTKNDGFDVQYAPAKRLAFKARWYALVGLILSPLIFFSWYIFDREVLVTADGILTTEPIEIEASQAVHVKKIHVKAGDKVTESDLLIELSSPALEQEIALLERKYKKMNRQSSLGLTELNTLHQQQIASLKANQIESKLLAEKFDAYSKKGVLGITEQLLIDQTITASAANYHLALINYEKDITSHKLLSTKTLFDIELAIASAKAKLMQLSIYPPKQALVNEILVKEGEFISPESRLISLSNLPEPIVQVYLSPKRMDYAQIGQTATITLPNGDKYHGVIERPTQLTKRLPAVLAEPFDGAKSAIKITLTISPIPDVTFEGLPVKVRFHYVNHE